MVANAKRIRRRELKPASVRVNPADHERIKQFADRHGMKIMHVYSMLGRVICDEDFARVCQETGCRPDRVLQAALRIFQASEPGVQMEAIRACAEGGGDALDAD